MPISMRALAQVFFMDKKTQPPDGDCALLKMVTNFDTKCTPLGYIVIRFAFC